MRLVITLLCCLCSMGQYAYASKYALLIGVSDYKSENVKDLDGPKYDIESLAAILPSWGIHNNNIKILLDKEATKKNIIQELNKLERKTKTGDQLFIYFSGHGTSPFDKSVGLEMPHTTGAFLPYDSLFDEGASSAEILNSLIVGQRDIQPILKKMDKNKQVFVVVDACYSENTARSFSSDFTKPQPRAASLSFSMLSNSSSGSSNNSDKNPLNAASSLAESYPYENVVFFSASSKYETAGDYNQAMDLANKTFDGKPHGVFTDAFLRVLTGLIPVDSNEDKILSYLETYNATSSYLSDTDQSPKISYKLGSRSIEHAIFATDNPQLIQDIKLTANNVSPPLAIFFSDELAQVKSVLSNIYGLKQVDKKALADLILSSNKNGMSVANHSGEIIKQFSVLNNTSIFTYFKSQYWLKKMRHLDGVGGFTVAINLSDGKNIGSTVKIGEEFKISLTTDETSNLWLISMNNNGGVNVLYPFNNSENQSTKKGAKSIMEIVAGDPIGEDWLVAYAFKGKVKELNKFVGASFSGASVRAEQFFNIIARKHKQMAKHEKRLITIN